MAGAVDACGTQRDSGGRLIDTIQPYPTFSEAIFLALRELVDVL